jgi:hypothetical protein
MPPEPVVGRERRDATSEVVVTVVVLGHVRRR